jgi:hypothetical protein
MDVTEELVEVRGPSWVAYLVMREGRCIAADDRLRLCKGKPRSMLRQRFKNRHWKAVVIQTTTAH